MVQRVTYRRRHSYATKSNKTRVIKTPGGKLTVQYPKKQASHPVCGVTGALLAGLPAHRPFDLARISKSKKKVQRIYGGCLSHKVVRERIIRAFLIEERKIVKKVLQLQKAKK